MKHHIMIVLLALLAMSELAFCQPGRKGLSQIDVRPTSQQVIASAKSILDARIVSTNCVPPDSNRWWAVERYKQWLIDDEYGFLLGQFIVMGSGIRPKNEPGGVVIHGELNILARELREMRPHIALPFWITVRMESPIARRE
ncbi:hypothetical protein HY491_03875 [Candidatus Woesearchaeota archaeon]|nr:hypothetical protein [Candidatus Woesearchaeota archaeon]